MATPLAFGFEGLSSVPKPEKEAPAACIAARSAGVSLQPRGLLKACGRWALLLPAALLQILGPANPGTSLAHETFKAMTRHENKTFENDHVVLDDGVFINCLFKNCSLEYAGGDTYIHNCQGDGCQLVWRGAAQRTVVLLQALGMMPIVPQQPPAPGGSLVH